jgi:hypothetical protein
MGYTTDFTGEVTIDPPLNEDETSFLSDFNATRRMHRTRGPLFVKGTGIQGQGNDKDVLNFNASDPDQPGLWCQWVPTEGGEALEWDGGEKFYNATEWMEYIVHRLLSPAAREYVNAHITEDPRLASFTCDHTVNGEIEASGEEPGDVWVIRVEDNVVTAADGKVVYDDPVVRVWTLTVDANSPIVTMVFATEQECFEALKEHYIDEADPDFDITTAEGMGALVDYLTEEQGVVLYIDEHSVVVPR